MISLTLAFLLVGEIEHPVEGTVAYGTIVTAEPVRTSPVTKTFRATAVAELTGTATWPNFCLRNPLSWPELRPSRRRGGFGGVGFGREKVRWRG